MQVGVVNEFETGSLYFLDNEYGIYPTSVLIVISLHVTPCMVDNAVNATTLECFE
jgi:hypothetical protein